MEQSKLISSVIAKLRIAYPYYFKDLDEEMILGMVKMYQDQLAGYDYEIVINAIDNIIKTSKYMPTIAEILENCENKISSFALDILNKMKDDGYFKYSTHGEELDKSQQSRNYEKAITFCETRIIPDWLLKDMIQYGFKANYLLETKNKETNELLNTETKLLGSVQ